MSLNRIVLVGRLTRDPELKYTPNGVPVAQLGIAVDRFTKDEDGQYQTDFFNIVAWRRSAEFANNYLKKGRLISVDGRLQSRSWVDQTSGQKRTVYEIVAENIQGLDKRPEDGGGPDVAEHDERQTTAAPTRATPVAAARASRPAPPVEDDIDESDPFADE